MIQKDLIFYISVACIAAGIVGLLVAGTWFGIKSPECHQKMSIADRSFNVSFGEAYCSNTDYTGTTDVAISFVLIIGGLFGLRRKIGRNS